MEIYHRSVLLKEVVEALHIQKDAWYLDCTLGDGGHSLEILRQGGKIVGIDVDPEALKRAGRRFEQERILPECYRLIKGNFRDLNNLVWQTGADQKFMAVIFDLGVSSLQLRTPGRGFSFLKEGPLDMRMDPTLEVTALDLIRGLNSGELYELFNKLGEEKLARKLAAAVVSTRQLNKIQTTRDLALLVEKIIGRRGKIHPATKIFQALRIAVNDELNALEEGLESSLKLVDQNGYIVVISFHSLEDRIVKNKFKQWRQQGLGQVLTKKPMVPTLQEISANPQARSAKLRVFQRQFNG